MTFDQAQKKLNQICFLFSQKVRILRAACALRECTFQCTNASECIHWCCQFTSTFFAIFPCYMLLPGCYHQFSFNLRERERKNATKIPFINLVLVNISISNVICSANRNKFIRNICGSFVYWLRFNLRNVDPILVLLFVFFSYAREWIAIWQRQTATTFKVYQHKQQTWCLATRNKCTFCLSINKKLIDECNIRFCGADIHKMSGAIYID